MDTPVEQLKKLLDIEDKDISVPPKSEMGDLSTNIAFKRIEGNENPNITAIKIISKLDLSKTMFSRVKAFGPYINFFIDYEKLSKRIIKEILTVKDYGEAKKTAKTILFEFPDPNTNKPLHLGHLLQTLLGTSLSKIIETQGYNVKRINIYNDRGIHICQ
jgi:arginyl-tRNA synthetase